MAAPSILPASDVLALGELDEFIGFHIRIAQLRAFEHFRSYDAMRGLTPALFSVLLLVERNADLKQANVASLLDVDRSTVVRMIDRLETLRLVRRTASTRDRRASPPQLTSRGRRLLKDAVTRTHRLEEEVFNKLTRVERAMLLELLRKANDFH